MEEKFALPAAGSGQCAQNPAFAVKKYDITGRDRLLLPLTLAVCTLAADSLLLHGLGLGVTVTVLAWYALLGLRLGWGRLTAGSGKWLLTANVLLGLWYALGSGWYFRLWNFGALAVLLPLHAAGCSGEARLPWRRPAMPQERFCLILSGLFGDLRAGFLTLGSFRSQRWDGRKAAGVLFGCAGALALLALLVPALLRADALFAHEMGALFTWELPELRFPTALGIGLALTPFACSLLWRLAHPREGKAAEERAPWLPPVALLVAYLPIDSIVARDQVRRGGGDVEYLLYELSYDALGYLDADADRVVRDGDGGFRRLGGLIGERRAQAAEECDAWESWNLSAYLASRGGTE